MTRVFFVDYENKCHNFLDRSVTAANNLANWDVKRRWRTHEPPLFHVHAFFRNDGPQPKVNGLNKKLSWLTQHECGTEPDAADWALIAMVRAYPVNPGDEIYVVCGGDRIYSRELIQHGHVKFRLIQVEHHTWLLLVTAATRTCANACSCAGWHTPAPVGLSAAGRRAAPRLLLLALALCLSDPHDPLRHLGAGSCASSRRHNLMYTQF